ncbi:MAG: LPS assembly lipoprotein LptE [Pseudomonadota bacterium]|nr:LPS assembly lipoprotein LptE [Pseudomonadota bacterium]
MSSSRGAFVLALSLALAGCGFHLRGEATYAFASIFVSAPGAPTMAAELRRALEATGSAKVVDDPKKAQVILDLPSVTDDKEVLSLSGAGSVQEYLLVKRVAFRLHDADGNEWLPTGQFSLRRSYTFSESEVLARDTQEQRLLKEMQTDAVQQLIRRLQAAKKPA